MNEGPLKQFRRANSLVLFWERGDFVIENYLSGKQLSAQPVLCQLLKGLEVFISLPELKSRFSGVPGGQPLLASLLDADILIEKGSALERKDKLVADAWAWGHNARYFHYSTQEVDYTFDHEAVRNHFERKARRNPPPPPTKKLKGKSIRLEGDFSHPVGGLWDALLRRRTTRNYDSRHISLQQLSTILLWTWGQTRFYNKSKLDRRILRTSPSGGARHPIEVYAIVQRVHSLKPNIYHYAVENHSLTLLRRKVPSSLIVELYSGQHWVRECAVLFVMTGVLARSMWKYDYARAYRVVQLDAGHLGQTLHLVATALGLGVFTTAAVQDRRIETLLGLDGVTEVMLYAGAVGHKLREIDS